MRMNHRGKWIGVTAALMLASVANAYEAVIVSNGGTISGRISFNGALPANPVLEVIRDTEICGTRIRADYYLGSGGGLQNVVVAIENIARGKEYEKRGAVSLDNKNCMFSPHVTTAVKNQKLWVNNSDPVLHNTHFYHGANMKTKYNIPMPLQNRIIKKPIRKAGIITAQCDAHDWMLGYVYVTSHPYATVTTPDGSFSLTDVPPGTYKVKIWHEKLGEVSQEVTVRAGATAMLNYSFSK